ncbi:hypothetical protein QL285_067346 [Trifolium repens]|nr:hypothetical protein QL285_067346 [Trifolium repens]
MILADSGVVSLIVWYWYAARTATFSYVHVLFLCVAVLGVEILVSWVFDSSCFLFMASIDKFQLFDSTCFLFMVSTNFNYLTVHAFCCVVALSSSVKRGIAKWDMLWEERIGLWG